MTENLRALTICLRLDSGRARVIAEVARLCGVDNPEIVRRMIDFWVTQHNPTPAPAPLGKPPGPNEPPRPTVRRQFA